MIEINKEVHNLIKKIQKGGLFDLDYGIDFDIECECLEDWNKDYAIFIIKFINESMPDMVKAEYYKEFRKYLKTYFDKDITVVLYDYPGEYEIYRKREGDNND